MLIVSPPTLLSQMIFTLARTEKESNNSSKTPKNENNKDFFYIFFYFFFSKILHLLNLYPFKLVELRLLSWLLLLLTLLTANDWGPLMIASATGTGR